MANTLKPGEKGLMTKTMKVVSTPVQKVKPSGKKLSKRLKNKK